LVTAPSTTATSSTTTLPASTTSTLPIAPDTTATSPKTTTTIPKPGHIVVTADRDRLVIQSGTKATIEYTLTNDGDESARFAYPPRMCFPDFSVWPDHESRVLPVAWPLPVDDHQYCASLAFVTVAPHASEMLPITIVAGLRDQTATNVVPAPPGDTSFLFRNSVAGGGALRLPVTVTAPATPPLTIDNPSDVTTASGAQNFVDFTITNHLPFAVRYTDQGPCSPDGDALCKATTPDGTFSGDLRKPPYATAVKPLYLTTFTLQANETRTVRAAVHGTTNLWDSGTGNSDLPPSVYYFDWDGEKVKYTVTP
jgi:hypothetical protein